MRSQLLLVLTGLALLRSSLSQAPYDFDNYCRTFSQFVPLHTFPDTKKILLDSYDYEDLTTGSKARWNIVDTDKDGETWNQRGGTCQRELNTCSFRQPDTQSNWFFTHYVSYEKAQEVLFEISYRFAPCKTHPDCDRDFANVYRFDVPSIQDVISQTNTANYLSNKMGVLRQESPFDFDTVQWRVVRPADSSIKGFYLGFQDTGTCGQVGRVIASHKKSPGFRDAANLVTCPDTALPPTGSTRLSTTTCSCDSNSVAVASLERSCDVNGVCTGSPACACKAGYELDSEGTCTACPAGTFKATASNTDRCLPCPLNSASLFEGAEVCPCDCNTVRPANIPTADCSKPPSSPLIAAGNPPQTSENGLTIFWRPAVEDGGNPDTLHYNVYTYDTTKQEYVKVNDADVKPEAMSDLVQFTLNNVDSSAGVVVTSATVATGDEETIQDLSQVQNRFIQFYVSVEQVTDKCTEETDTKVTAEPVPSTSDTTVEEAGTETIPIVKSVIVPKETVVLEETTPGVDVQPEEPKLYFSLGGNTLTNGSTVSLDDIGEGEAALLCHTDHLNCCRASREGEFYYPDGSLVPVRAAGRSVYRNRGDGFIRLNHVGGAGTPVGQYRCDIPDSTGQVQKLFVTIQ